MQGDILFFISAALGGFLGAFFRELILPLMPFYISWFPVLLINILGSFTIDIIYGFEKRLHPRMKDFCAVGFRGGFSTFSHFTYQTFDLLKNGYFITALLNVLFSVCPQNLYQDFRMFLRLTSRVLLSAFAQDQPKVLSVEEPSYE